MIYSAVEQLMGGVAKIKYVSNDYDDVCEYIDKTIHNCTLEILKDEEYENAKLNNFYLE